MLLFILKLFFYIYLYNIPIDMDMYVGVTIQLNLFFHGLIYISSVWDTVYYEYEKIPVHMYIAVADADGW